ncbi:MAG TPA: ACT domain-containing protein [Spirochaetota bacterium]|nr:ACT domain-containing protein [Spirochaetota bacterium]HPS87662.1 ACT domain-containing protein [Spirochaetota bacterium]
MNVTQLSAFVTNKPGHLQRVLKVLADENINIITLTIAETVDFGILRMIVNDPDKGYRVLKEQNITSSITDVLALEIDDTPGSLFNALDVFAQMNLNIEYMYAFTEKRDGKAVMIFRFEDVETAKKALIDKGYNIVRKIDIIGENK